MKKEEMDALIYDAKAKLLKNGVDEKTAGVIIKETTPLGCKITAHLVIIKFVEVHPLI